MINALTVKEKTILSNLKYIWHISKLILFLPKYFSGNHVEI